MKIVLGDNPFFGVHHGEGGRLLENDSDRFSNAATVIASAIECGIDTMMVSNHITAPDLLDRCMAQNASLPQIALVVPVPNIYNDIVSRFGYIGLLKTVALAVGSNLIPILLSFFRGGVSRVAACVLVSYELRRMKKYRNNISHLCLHNVLVDMCLAGNNVKFLKDFILVCESGGFEPVLITQNYLSLSSALGALKYTACFSYNPNGYMVNPSLASVEDALEDRSHRSDLDHKIWLMQIFGSGATDLISLKSFLQKTPSVDAILYATTKAERIPEFSNLFQGDNTKRY